jgi:hypothetical protein
MNEKISMLFTNKIVHRGNFKVLNYCAKAAKFGPVLRVLSVMLKGITL